MIGESTLVHCARFRENAAGELVDVGFDCMQRGRTVESDEEFIRLAEERARRFKKAAQSREAARSPGASGIPFSSSASAAGPEAA